MDRPKRIAGFIIPGITATLPLPLLPILICIEELIFGRQRAKLIAGTGLIIIGLLICNPVSPNPVTIEHR